MRVLCVNQGWLTSHGWCETRSLLCTCQHIPSSGSFAALHSHTAGWNRDGSPSYEKWSWTRDGASLTILVTVKSRGSATPLTPVGCPLHVFKGREDFIHTTNVQNPSHSLKVNEFAALSISGLVSLYTGYKPNNVCPTMNGVA